MSVIGEEKEWNKVANILSLSKIAQLVTCDHKKNYIVYIYIGKPN